MRNIIKSFLADVRELNFSSKKRLIKFIGCCLVPILYAIVCMIAFWDPMSNIDKSKVAFLDNDTPVGLVQYAKYNEDGSFDSTGIKIATDEKYKILNNEQFNEQYKNNTLANDEQTVYFSDQTSINFKKISDDTELERKIFDGPNGLSNYDKNLKTIYQNTQDKSYYAFIVTGYQTAIQLFINSSHIFSIQKQGKTMEDTTYGFSVNSSSGVLNFNNVRYVNSKNARKEYKANNYNIQLFFDHGLTSEFITNLNFLFNNLSSNKPIKTINNIINLLAEVKNLKVYTSYSQNFLFGTFMYTIRNFKFSFIANLLDHLFESNKPIPNLIVEKVKKDLNIDLRQITKIISEGSINNERETSKQITNYGIGLGQLFVLIAISAGSIAITFVLDRSKRIRRASPIQWFFGKYLNMLFMGWIQVTLLTMVATLVGYYKVGLLSCFELWLWWLFVDAAILFVFACLWFAFRSEALGRIFMILYLLINIALGWGSFPTFMMSKAYDIISRFTIYRYSSKTTSNIIYGQYSYGVRLFENIGAILLICLVFFVIALLTAKLRYRDIHYGSYKGKFVILGLEDAKIDTNQFYMRRIDCILYKLNSKRAKIINNTRDKIRISELNAELNFIKSLGDEEKAKKERKIQKIKRKLELLNSRFDTNNDKLFVKAAKERRSSFLSLKLEKINLKINQLKSNSIDEDDKKYIKLKNKKEQLDSRVKLSNKKTFQFKVDALTKLINKCEEKIQSDNLKKNDTKMVYNWQYLEDLTRVDYIALNKKTNKYNSIYKGFKWFGDGSDYKPELPALSDDVLTSRND